MLPTSPSSSLSILPKPIFVAVALLSALPTLAAAQASDLPAPLRFGIEYNRAIPTGEFAKVTAPAAGFLAWTALPLARQSPLTIIAEFSVLTVPQSSVDVPLSSGDSLRVDLRTTLSFIGVGPRIEARFYRFSLAASLMPGFTRVITDLNGVTGGGATRQSVAVSNSNYAAGIKGGLSADVPIHFGSRATGIGLTGGVDYTVSGSAPFPRAESFRYDQSGNVLTLERPDVQLNHWRWHIGLGIEF